jgi:hypothetical protein
MGRTLDPSIFLSVSQSFHFSVCIISNSSLVTN